MNLERSIHNLSKRIERLDTFDGGSNDSNYWRGKKIIPLSEWTRLTGTHFALQYFPDDFDKCQTFLTECELKGSDDKTRKWYSDYLDLMEHQRNPNYGKSKCFHCLLSPDRDDPIFIGINRLVAKGLEDNKDNNNPILYPCHIANRFECPYEKGKKIIEAKFDQDLFALDRMAYEVELAFAKAELEREIDNIQIRTIQSIYHACTNLEIHSIKLLSALSRNSLQRKALLLLLS